MVCEKNISFVTDFIIIGKHRMITDCFEYINILAFIII